MADYRMVYELHKIDGNTKEDSVIYVGNSKEIRENMNIPIRYQMNAIPKAIHYGEKDKYYIKPLYCLDKTYSFYEEKTGKEIFRGTIKEIAFHCGFKYNEILELAYTKPEQIHPDFHLYRMKLLPKEEWKITNKKG